MFLLFRWTVTPWMQHSTSVDLSVSVDSPLLDVIPASHVAILVFLIPVHSAISRTGVNQLFLSNLYLQLNFIPLQAFPSSYPCGFGHIDIECEIEPFDMSSMTEEKVRYR